MFNLEKDRVLTSGNGFLILGSAWMIFWLFPAFHLFQGDSRWGHNFALPVTFIAVGLAYNVRVISCQLAAAIASFLIIPTLLAFWPWNVATAISLAFLSIIIVLYLLERGRKTELVNTNPRLKAWLKMHLLTFCYLGITHMSLIFYLVRWNNPDAFNAYLPEEHEVSTSIFNAMLLILIPIAIVERFVKKIGIFTVARAGFIWAMLMIIIPLLSILTIGQ